MLPRSSTLASRHLLRPSAAGPASSPAQSARLATPLGAQASHQSTSSNQQQGQQGSASFGGVAGKALAAAMGVAVGVTAYKKFAGAELPNPLMLQAKAIEGISPEAEQEILHKENRIRKFGTMPEIFDFFATYQFIDKLGKKTTLMSVKDFYNSVTPGSTLTHGTGRGVYTIIHEEDIGSKKLYEDESVPVQDSLLNKIQRHGLITYVDFAFLLNILSTPKRYLDIAFHAFDVSADGSCEAKEFAHVMARIANYKGDPEELLTEGKSGVITYIFGTDRKRVMSRTEFIRLQRELIQDVLYLEFLRYTTDDSKQTISEIDFCNHLLYDSSMPSKKKARMLKRVEKAFKNSPGVTFDEFKNFYYILFGGSDLERAMFFLDSEKNGVTRDEFCNIAKWVANRGISEHIVDVIFTLLDEDNDKHLSVEEFQPVLFQWRHTRGFQKASLQVKLGHLKI